MAKTAPLPEMTDEEQAALEAVQQEAKTAFSLTDRLTGKHFRKDRVLVFEDEGPATVYAAMQGKLEQAQATLARIEPGPQYDELLAAFNEAEEEANAQREVMMQSALAIHLTALPQAAYDRATRKARKRAGIHGGQPLDDDQREALNEAHTDLLIGYAIERIVDSTGAEATFDREKIGAHLRANLPVPQYARLTQKFNLLVFNDSLGRVATADPGF